ncbi:hypothetical protein ACN38_g13021, partial [Penicillium nordicum]
TAQIVEIAGFVILENQRVLNISRGAHTVQYRQISVMKYNIHLAGHTKLGITVRYT